ncbi:MAG TPA: hypothetical protein VHM90_02740 [Phycisphaerae bacterium]|jgi:hypothetical protein|nr:hypothetical protein [Phycisphaerae bacterium]
MKRIFWMIIPLLLAACASQDDSAQQAARRSYGPPSNFGGGPHTGMEHFSGTGNFGPGNMNMKPAVPGGFKGY